MHSQVRGQPEPEQRTCRSAHYRPPSSARATGPVSATARHCIHKPAGSPNQNSAHADQHIIAHRALLVPLGQSAPQLGIAFTSPRAARTRTAHMQISTLSPTELCSCHWARPTAHCIHKPEGSPEPEQRTCRSAHYRPPSSARATEPVSATARHCIHKPAGSPNQNSAHADQHIIAHRALLWYH